MVSHLTQRKNLKNIAADNTFCVDFSQYQLDVNSLSPGSDVLTRIADDLTHTDFASTLALDRHADTTTLQSFPPPISGWMRRPEEDRDLGHKVIAWMKSQYKGLF